MEHRMNQTRRQLPPPATNKRKEREETFDFLKPSTRTPKPVQPRPLAPIKTSRFASHPATPPPSPLSNKPPKPVLPPPSPVNKFAKPVPPPVLAPPPLINKLPKPAIPRPPAPIKPSQETPAPQMAPPPTPAPAKAMSDNKLLAGYLAHEFLTKGTLFGQPWKPAQADSVPVSRVGNSSDFGRTMKPPSSSSSSSSSGSVYSQKGKAAEPPKKRESQAIKNQRYAEVSDLLKGNKGVHIKGIVNPSQLVRMLHLQ